MSVVLAFFQSVLHGVGIIQMIKKSDHVMTNTSWHTVDGHSLQYSCCKFFKSTKFKAYFICLMEFVSVKLFSITYLGLHLARKSKLNKLANKL